MKKILFIRFSSIGDLILTTPVIRCVKRQVAGAEIHYLTKAAYAPVLVGNPLIKKLFTIQSSVSEVMETLRAERYDFVVDLHRNIRSARVVRGLRPPASASFPKLNLAKWLLVNMKINRLPDVHVVDRYFEAVLPLQVENDGGGAEYTISESDEVGLSDLPGHFREGFFAVVVGGNYFTKQMPVKLLLKICTGLNRPVVLLGGAEDIEKGLVLKKTLGDRAYNAVGLCSLDGSASLIKKANAVITPDTGLMHLAAALRKPVISVWGNTVPAFGMFPYFADVHKPLSHVFEVQGLPCRPCSKLGFRHCPKGHFSCMDGHDADQIVQLANHYA